MWTLEVRTLNCVMTVCTTVSWTYFLSFFLVVFFGWDISAFLRKDVYVDGGGLNYTSMSELGKTYSLNINHQHDQRVRRSTASRSPKSRFSKKSLFCIGSKWNIIPGAGYGLLFAIYLVYSCGLKDKKQNRCTINITILEKKEAESLYISCEYSYLMFYVSVRTTTSNSNCTLKYRAQNTGYCSNMRPRVLDSVWRTWGALVVPSGKHHLLVG